MWLVSLARDMAHSHRKCREVVARAGGIGLFDADSQAGQLAWWTKEGGGQSANYTFFSTTECSECSMNLGIEIENINNITYV